MPSSPLAQPPDPLGEGRLGLAQVPVSTPASPAPEEMKAPQFAAPVFAGTMFLSAALLFVIEPMFAKMSLPLFGGSAAVWTTCIVFFQATLLAGYAYAHASAKWLNRPAQVAIHVVVLSAACAVLPIGIPAGWTPPAEANPVWWLIRLLLVAVGLPFFALSATTPLLQKWFAHSRHPASADPYFLYAASNSGSLLGLLSYPFVLEPLLRLSDQSRLWVWGYGVFFFLAAGCVVLVGRRVWAPASHMSPQSAVPPEVAAGARTDEAPTLAACLRWIALAFVPSSLMLGVTTTLTTDIPPVPLFWVVPLAIYLLSFVLVFARRPLISHRWISRRLPLLILAAAIPIVLKGVLPLYFMLPIDLLALFAVGMVCHGELAHTRPDARHLTGFYLWVALGGVLGGAFNALLAPMIFTTVLEYPLALVLAALLCPPMNDRDDSRRAQWLDYLLPAALGLAVVAAIHELQSNGVAPGRLFNFAVFGTAAVCCLRFAARPRRFGLGVAALILASQTYNGLAGHVLHSERSFFGVYRVSDDAETGCRMLLHGSTAHGLESLDPRRACEPLAYYTRSGPIGQVFQAFRGSPLENDVALIGLGAGAMACYREPGERFTFYEIDPTVLRIAQDRRYFSYLSGCGGKVDVVLGDARLRLREAPPHLYGIMVLDAFSGDAVPTHLLTREALALYLSKLAPHGLLAYHISNRYLDLHGVLANLAHNAGLCCVANDNAEVSAEERRGGKYASWWVVMARGPDDLEPLVSDSRWRYLPAPPDSRVWTDDYSNILSILRFR